MSEDRKNLMSKVTAEINILLANNELIAVEGLGVLHAAMNNVALQICHGDRAETGKFFLEYVLPRIVAGADDLIKIGGTATPSHYGHDSLN